MPIPVDLPQLIAELSRPSAYPYPVEEVQVRQTHISVVFLAGSSVFKIKKPVRLPFLDFQSLDQRKFYCDEEVRLNRRLAANVYRGVVPVRMTSDGLRMNVDDGDIVEWAVEMTRLPDQATLKARGERNCLTDAQVRRLAHRIAEFHQSVKPVPADQPTELSGKPVGFESIATSISDNISSAEQQVGKSITQSVFDRLRRATENALQRLQPLIERRVKDGRIRELHGDLRLDHVYLFEDRSAPDDLVIVDCIEFNADFRTIDVVADMAFLAMDLQFAGWRKLARAFCQEYFAAVDDDAGKELLPLYLSYRAAVRGKVESILATENEVPRDQREAALRRATAYWLLALGELVPPDERPVLVLDSGLPGTGKSTLARRLAESARFQWIRSDAVRKELAGPQSAEPGSGDYQAGIYSAEWTDRTYSECLQRAVTALKQGNRVIVDASFGEDRRRAQFLQQAIELGVPAVWLVCQASPEIVRKRLAERRNDLSDADWGVYKQAAANWQRATELSQRFQVAIDTEQQPEVLLQQAVAAISDATSNPL